MIWGVLLGWGDVWGDVLLRGVKVGCRGLEGIGEELALELSIYRAILKSSGKSHKTGDHPGLRR